MATETDGPVEETLTKEVNLVAYAAEGTPRNLRSWVEELTDVDVTTTERETKTKWKLIADLGGSWEFERTLMGTQYDEDEVEEEKKKLEKSNSNVRLEKEKKTKENRINTLKQAGKELLKSVKNELPEEVDGEFTRQWGGSTLKWQNEVGRTAAKISSANFDERRILAHESGRSSDDLYESMTESNSVQYTIELEAESDEMLDELTQDIVLGLKKSMSRMSGIGKTRHMECKTQITREGECYNI